MAREVIGRGGNDQFFRNKSSKVFMVAGYLLGAHSTSGVLLSLSAGDYKQAASHGAQAALEIGGSTWILHRRKKANSQSPEQLISPKK